MNRLVVLLAMLAVAPGGQGQAAAVPAAGESARAQDHAGALVDIISASMDERVAAAIARIHGVDRRLLALRGYLRAGPGLAERWSWTADQITVFSGSYENRVIQTEVERVRQAFAAANAGFELWVNPEVRSIDTQLANWNSNASVGSAAAHLLAAFRQWVASPTVSVLPDGDLPQAAEKFLAGFVPKPTPTLAAPGLSPHGQMRAIDFQIRKDGKTVAGPDSATIATAWDAAGWTQKLKAAVIAGSSRFSGPLESPREPWHYTFVSVP
jgi:hypothetical protein